MSAVGYTTRGQIIKAVHFITSPISHMEPANHLNAVCAIGFEPILAAQFSTLALSHDLWLMHVPIPNMGFHNMHMLSCGRLTASKTQEYRAD